jgi:hypothetical protein
MICSMPGIIKRRNGWNGFTVNVISDLHMRMLFSNYNNVSRKLLAREFQEVTDRETRVTTMGSLIFFNPFF